MSENPVLSIEKAITERKEREGHAFLLAFRQKCLDTFSNVHILGRDSDDQAEEWDMFFENIGILYDRLLEDNPEKSYLQVLEMMSDIVSYQDVTWIEVTREMKQEIVNIFRSQLEEMYEGDGEVIEIRNK